ncbi:MAG: glutamate 5-kinase [Gammaproteobacteria bacterium]|jgi:glutamate 5-kinase
MPSGYEPHGGKCRRGNLLRTPPKRCVVKIGTALLTNDGRGLDHQMIGQIADQIAELVGQGIEVALVSSGAIAEGVRRLGWTRRPDAVHELQAAAAVGQMGFIQAYEARFACHGLHSAQILLTHDDISDRERYLNARSTLRTLLALSVVPVVNENDTISTEEIRFGDNDSVAGLVANLIEADELYILTDQAGLYTADPRVDPRATLIEVGEVGDRTLAAMAGPGGTLGRGGMQTKLRAAELAARSGTTTVIASGREERVLTRLAAGESLGTRLVSAQIPMAARKRWMASQLQLSGYLVLDEGAIAVLLRQGRSLLPVGVREVRGQFSRGAIVGCLDAAGNEIARGLVGYSSDETKRILGCPTSSIAARLGYVIEPELIHRDNLVLTATDSSLLRDFAAKRDLNA